MFGRCHRELAESSPKVCWEVCRELAGSSPEECRKVHRKFTDRLSGARREFTGRMLEVHWEFTEGNQELAGGSSKRCRECWARIKLAHQAKVRTMQWDLAGSSLGVWHSEERSTLYARGNMRTNKLRRMHSAQRLGWLSLSYDLTLATKLDGAQVTRELDCSSANIRLRQPDKLQDKVKKGRRCKTTDSRVMGSTTPWYRRDRTSIESSIPCSHGGRALVIKEAEEVENAKTNSKYQDNMEGQRPRNFLRLVSTDFSSR
ncbi:hypothetical protein B296_00003617 [Ensete ventricosum]|uniref:Uncharacterized protein n=1 Tax=Ensete ventricosum TaxID=4639 RepID=A0A427B770_ENSVE|nr:hypothetical protein B296_00003617 [Ensete ventricosum]